MEQLTDQQIEAEKKEAQQEVQRILGQLEEVSPGITEGASALLGSGAGAGCSLAALSAAGTTGLSAAGITSGLAAAGGIVGGGMVAGIGVLAAPIAALGIGAYAVAKSKKDAKLSAALGQAIGKLYGIVAHLEKNATYFTHEIAGINAEIDRLTSKQKKIQGKK